MVPAGESSTSHCPSLLPISPGSHWDLLKRKFDPCVSTSQMEMSPCRLWSWISKGLPECPVLSWT